MNRTSMNTWKLTGIGLMLALGALTACNPDSAEEDDPFSPERAITIGDVEGAAQDSQGGGDVGGFEAGDLTVPRQLSFDQTPIGDSNRKQLRLASSGRGNLRIDAISLKEDDADSDREIVPVGEETLGYLQALEEGKTIYVAPSERLTLEFEWRPVNVTSDEATLTIESNDAQDPATEVRLTTQELGPEIDTEPEVRFPRVAAGERDAQLTFIRNSGQSALQLKDIVLSPASTTDFSISFPSAESPDDEDADSDSWKSTLEPGEQIDVRVAFTPDSDAPVEADLIISSNDPDEPNTTIPLVGNAGTPCIKLGGVTEVESPSDDETHLLEFGDSQIGQATTKTVTLENCSREQDLEISAIDLVDDGDEVFTLGTLPEGLDGGPVIIPPRESATFQVDYTPEDDETNAGRVIIASNDEVNRELRVDISGKGTSNVCPVAVAEASIVGSSGRPATEISTIPLKTIQFSGVNSRDPDGEVQRYEWNIISQPTNSAARLTPNNRASEPKLFLDLAGEYEIELVVYDALGQASCESAVITIQATPDEDIHVQLVWDTYSDNDQSDEFGTDLDLHYLHPAGRWDLDPYDIFWRNPEADWGVVGDNSDDPSLDIDDTDGQGPENVNHDNPESGKTYSVGAYYYNDNGFGPSYATVRIYIEGQLQLELRDKFLQKEDIFWEVAQISWPSKQIFALDRIHQGFPRRQ